MARLNFASSPQSATADTPVAPARQKPPLWLFICGLAALLSVVVVTNLGPPLAANGSATWKAAHFLSHMGDNGFVAMSLFLVLGPPLCALGRGLVQRSLWHVLDATIMEFVVVDGLGKRFLIGLHRPNSLEPGFPSGHATYAFLVCWLVALRYPRLAPLWYAIAVAICWSRVALGAHFPYQVFAGAIIGWLLAYGTTSLKLGLLLPRIFAPLFPQLKAAETST